MRPDREDTSRQEQAVRAARASFAGLLLDLAFAAAREGADDVDAEALALSKRLTSKAKRPPTADTADLLGALSAARRGRDDYSTDYDVLEQRVRDAERTLDAAVYDLATARGAGG